MAENDNKIIDNDKKISDKTLYLFSTNEINIRSTETVIKMIPIIKIILDKVFVFSL